ncbi:MAG TPA: DegT/DnrJ/EryC1/StrS aminotransferase family protein [Vicinamibacterales bacterium]|jgi:CDP-6-deoxy-D-xylo-4-hexulose-3-dehydrase
MAFNWPLMSNNVTREDLQALTVYLAGENPMITQAGQVRAFEQEWAAWLGVKHSVMVNSGASANLVTMAAVRECFGDGEVIVPTLTWISDIASVLHAGLAPVFVDINPRTLGMDTDCVLTALTPRTRAVFLTHVLGFNALGDRLLDELRARGIALVEDVCESHGATFRGRKLGTFGLVSNFSFYYAHHLTTGEGGMVCTNDDRIFDIVRMYRSHGLVRESVSAETRGAYEQRHPDLNPEFIFAYPAYNVRSTELNAVIGRSQLPRLDGNNDQRRENFRAFLAQLDTRWFQTDFDAEGSCNYAFTLVLRQPDAGLRDRVERALRDNGIEFRRGTSGGGNQLRQPYLRRLYPEIDPASFPNVDHVHFYGWYIGNYPGLPAAWIADLCRLLNDTASGTR